MDTDSERNGIQRDGNHIYFYADVDELSCLALLRELRAADIELRAERVKSGAPDVLPPTPIILHVLSYGGDMFPAFGVADQIARLKTPVYSVIEGVAASAATIIAMACQRRYITPSSFVLIHQLSAMQWGTYAETQDNARLLDMLMDKMATFYAAHSAVSKKQVKRILRRDSWFDADEALLLGFVDEVA